MFESIRDWLRFPELGGRFGSLSAREMRNTLSDSHIHVFFSLREMIILNAGPKHKSKSMLHSYRAEETEYGFLDSQGIQDVHPGGEISKRKKP